MVTSGTQLWVRVRKFDPYVIQTFCLRGTANQKKADLKEERQLKQLVSDRSWTEGLNDGAE